MKSTKIFFLFALFLFLSFGKANAQLPAKIISGQLIINDGSFKPDPTKYAAVTNELTTRLKTNPDDTTSLFYRALLYSYLNNIMAKPYPSKAALDELMTAKSMAEKAITLHMQDFRLKVLRAQIYQELCYQFSADESWKYNNEQIAERRRQFNKYKDLANTYYDDAASLDKGNAYDYQKLKVNSAYPIR